MQCCGQKMNSELLKQKAKMLEEYFCIHMHKRGNLSRLPMILDQYTPHMDRFPKFVLSLGNDVDWEDEKNCFRVISAALGNFYAMHPPMLPNTSGEGLHFYKKRKLFRSCAEENAHDGTGSDAKAKNEVEPELLSEADCMGPG